MANVLITGGTGLVGSRLSEMLLDKSYTVSHLSRKKRNRSKVKVFQWNINTNWIEDGAIESADYIVHLAGAGVADKRWTSKRKEEIVSSRINSSKLLHRYLQEKEHTVKGFIGASAIGYYGDRGQEVLTEKAKASNSFLGRICQQWEHTNQKIKKLDIRTVLLRIGIVLSTQGGALPKTAMSIKYGLGTVFGDGQQYYSWIHLDDLCQLIIAAIEKEEMNGTYNAVAPNPVTNRAFTQAIKTAMGKRGLTMRIPTFLLQRALGQLSAVLLDSAHVSAEKVIETGFKFQYPLIEEALQELYA